MPKANFPVAVIGKITNSPTTVFNTYELIFRDHVFNQSFDGWRSRRRIIGTMSAGFENAVWTERINFTTRDGGWGWWHPGDGEDGNIWDAPRDGRLYGRILEKWEPVVTSSTTAPPNPFKEQYWWNPSTNQLRIWSNDTWILIVDPSWALASGILVSPTVQGASDVQSALVALNDAIGHAGGGTITSVQGTPGRIIGGATVGSAVLDLANTAVNPGTYQGLTIDQWGRTTAAANQNYLTRTAADSLYAPLGTTGASLSISSSTPSPPTTFWWDPSIARMFIYEAPPGPGYVGVSQPATRLPGVTDGSDAAPGEVGEVVSAPDETAGVIVGSYVQGAVPWATAPVVTSMTLQPGDWDVHAMGEADPTGTPTQITWATFQITTTSGVISAWPKTQAIFPMWTSATGNIGSAAGLYCRVSIATATNIRLSAAFVGSVGAASPGTTGLGFGSLVARRMR